MCVNILECLAVGISDKGNLSCSQLWIPKVEAWRSPAENREGDEAISQAVMSASNGNAQPQTEMHRLKWKGRHMYVTSHMVGSQCWQAEACKTQHSRDGMRGSWVNYICTRGWQYIRMSLNVQYSWKERLLIEKKFGEDAFKTIELGSMRKLQGYSGGLPRLLIWVQSPLPEVEVSLWPIHMCLWHMHVPHT